MATRLHLSHIIEVDIVILTQDSVRQMCPSRTKLLPFGRNSLANKMGVSVVAATLALTRDPDEDGGASTFVKSLVNVLHFRCTQ